MTCEINKAIFKSWFKDDLNFQRFLELTWNYYRNNSDIPNCGEKKAILLLNEQLRHTNITKINKTLLTEDMKNFYKKEITHHIFDNIENIPLEIGLFKGNNDQEYKYLVSVNNSLIPYILYAEVNGLDIYFTKLNKQHEFVKKFSELKNKVSDKTVFKKYKIHLLNDSRFIW